MSQDQSHRESCSIAEKISELTGENPAACYQCAKCSAGCPMAEEMELKPHEMMRLIQLGKSEKLMESESPWLCLTCETCTARCPNECDPARVIDGLREMMAKDGKRAPRKIAAFHKSFLEQIQLFGRVFELGLVGAYKLRSGDLLADVQNAPTMFAKGKLALVPQRIKGIKEVRKIFAACRKEEAK
jgi:heterodisulfide reductase subunit C2